MKTNTNIEEKKEFDEKECQIRWKEGFMNVVCGHPFPCPKHTSREEFNSFITTLLHSEREKAFQEGKDIGMKADEVLREEGRVEERERLIESINDDVMYLGRILKNELKKI